MCAVARLESAIERKAVNAIAEKLGVYSIKLNGPGTRGWPDRVFLVPGGRPVFIEFKAKRGRLSPRQEYIIEVLVAHGYTVGVCNDADTAFQLVVNAVEAARVSGARGKVPSQPGGCGFAPRSRLRKDKLHTGGD